MVKLLDCTLRDGGYINDWRFGKAAVEDMVQGLVESGVDIVELGFLKDEPYQPNRTVFRNVDQIRAFLPNEKKGAEFAVMVEVGNPIPLELLRERQAGDVEIIRVIVWKTRHNQAGRIEDALEEGFRYCQGIVERGYKLCVQPARVDQYTDIEFIHMLEQFQKLNPMAIYVVDSWGTQDTRQVMHYVDLADKNLRKDIAVGYHGHNNLMQAFGTAQEFLRRDFDRERIVDASVYGIGRGAGNLNLELIAEYMNRRLEKKYDTAPMTEIYESYIKDIYRQHPWGYSIPYYLTAKYNCNPRYGEYYGLELDMSSVQIDRILSCMGEDDRVMFSRDKAEHYRNEVISRET